MKSLLVLLLTIFPLLSLASSRGEDQFIEKVYSVIEAKNGTFREVAPADLNPKQLAGLMKAAREEADIWYDTILEGDYMLKSEADIEVVELSQYYSASGELVAYRAVIQHAAFDVGEDNCTPGYISSGIFVSPDFRFHFRDEDAIEDFTEL